MRASLFTCLLAAAICGVVAAQPEAGLYGEVVGGGGQGRGVRGAAGAAGGG
jgi:hypothetical protein